jgi:hypothetical protein
LEVAAGGVDFVTGGGRVEGGHEVVLGGTCCAL